MRGNDRFDQQILTNDTQSVIWAIGPVNSKGEVSYHSKRIRGDLKLDFGRIPQWNCPLAGQKGRKGAKAKAEEGAGQEGKRQAGIVSASLDVIMVEKREKRGPRLIKL